MNIPMNDFFYDFPKIFEHFPKISEDSKKVVSRPDKHLRTFSKKFRRLPEISEENPMMFRSHSNTSEFSLSYYIITSSYLVFIK